MATKMNAEIIKAFEKERKIKIAALSKELSMAISELKKMLGSTRDKRHPESVGAAAYIEEEKILKETKEIETKLRGITKQLNINRWDEAGKEVLRKKYPHELAQAAKLREDFCAINRAKTKIAAISNALERAKAELKIGRAIGYNELGDIQERLRLEQLRKDND